MIKQILTIGFGLLISSPLHAQQTYTFYGYVSCVKGQLGCAQWPAPPHSWVTFKFGNGLPYAECLALQQGSRALTGGDGFCEPFIQ